MAFYYVKSGGTATGDGGRYTSEKANNSWATEFTATSEYYDSIESAIEDPTKPYVDGDVIYISSASTLSSGSSITITMSVVPDNPVMVYSVDDGAVNDYLAGAFEDAVGTSSDYTISTNALVLHYHGVTIRAGDDIAVLQSNCGFTFTDSTLRLIGSGDKLLCSGDGNYFNLTNSHIVSDIGTTSFIISMTSNGKIEMYGGSISATTGSLNDLISGGGTNGGQRAKFVGVDLSGHGAGTFLLGSFGGDPVTDDPMLVEIIGCKLNANVGFVEESFSNYRHKFFMTNSSSDSDAAEYQFFQRTWAGDVEDEFDGGIHRDESTAFSGGTKVSMKVSTNSECGMGRPLIFDLPARFAELSSASSDTIRLYFAQANTQADLTDTNCWAELHYPDGTIKNLYNYATNRASDFLAAGTQHTDDSGSSTWLDGVSALTGHDEYRMDVSTSGDAGADSVPIIRIYIAEPSITVYFDTTVDVVA